MGAGGLIWFMIVEGDDQYVHTFFSPNGYTDPRTSTSCGLVPKRELRDGDPQRDGCEACLSADQETGIVT